MSLLTSWRFPGVYLEESHFCLKLQTHLTFALIFATSWTPFGCPNVFQIVTISLSNWGTNLELVLVSICATCLSQSCLAHIRFFHHSDLGAFGLSTVSLVIEILQFRSIWGPKTLQIQVAKRSKDLSENRLVLGTHLLRFRLLFGAPRFEANCPGHPQTSLWCTRRPPWLLLSTGLAA